MPTPPLAPSRSTGPPSLTVPLHAAAGENLRGAGLMVASVAAFTINDAAIKYLLLSFPLYEAIFLRGLVISAILGLLVLRPGGLSLRMSPADGGLLLLRIAGEVGCAFLYIEALHHMPLGDLSALAQSLPILVMLAGALIFRERIGWRRFSAAGVGLAGVLLILRPGTPAFDGWSLVGLAAVLMVAVRDLATRAFSPAITSSTIAFSSAVGVALAALFWPSGEVWRLPDAREGALLLFTGLVLVVGYITAIAAMRVGEIGFVSPFRYASLLIAIALGVVVFGDWPDLWTWAGSALVVAAGLYVILREARLRGGERGLAPGPGSGSGC